MHYAVIGAGFGDEGKGLMTDFLCRKLAAEGVTPLNVRFNGGAQAGHTVVTQTDRHVFGHLGSGTFAGARTYLSQDFIVNPLALLQERQIFSASQPIIHPHAKVTTVFDVTLNVFREIARGQNRHGSCGMGINETVTRHHAGHELWAADLDKPELLNHLLWGIYKNWFLPQVLELQNKITKDTREHYLELATVENELSLFDKVQDYYHVLSLPFQWMGGPIIFEGAQGLQLDEELGVFPHVTRSITGLLGAYRAADEMGVAEPIQPVYVTRSYKTRHGAGPLDHEGISFIDKEIVDKTNTTGLWQGHFRYAPLDLRSLRKYIEMDLARLNTRDVQFPLLAVTHLDKIESKIMIIDLDGNQVWVDDKELLKELSKVARVGFASYGERASEVRCFEQQ